MCLCVGGSFTTLVSVCTLLLLLSTIASGRGRYKIETANTKEGQLNVCVPLMATKIGISYSNKHC